MSMTMKIAGLTLAVLGGAIRGRQSTGRIRTSRHRQGLAEPLSHFIEINWQKYVL
jgi:hypothetical protein